VRRHHFELWNDHDVTKMFPLPGGDANVCDSQDAEEHGYSKRNLGKKQVFNFLQKNFEHTKRVTKWVRNTIQKKYICIIYVYVKIVREHKQL
jgi:hypothetical protein